MRHARSRFDVELSHADDTVRIVVKDRSTAPPVLQHPELDADSGLGLRIVAKLSSEWGFDVACDGKRVWARVADLPLPWPRE